MRASAASLVLVLIAVLAAGCDRPPPLGPRPDEGLYMPIRESLLAGGSAAGGAGPTQSTGTGWGTLSGQFVFDPAAAIPQPARLTVDKDPGTCEQHPLFDQTLQIDSASRGIAGVVVFARRTGRVHESAAQPAEPQVVFDQKACEFLSPVAAVQIGQEVLVKNSDPIGHNTNIDGTGFNQLIAADASATFTPSGETTQPAAVTCNVHPWMKAYMLIRKDGYFAVTDKEGRFEIPNLPAGEEIEFQVWHPHATGSQGSLVLDQPELKWNDRGRFRLQLEPDQSRELQLTVPAGAIN